MTFWNLYFILKFALFATGHLQPFWLANLAFAVALAERRRPDVVVMDLRMPQMDGIEATEEIIQRVPDARVLVFTAYSERALLQRGLEVVARDEDRRVPLGGVGGVLEAAVRQLVQRPQRDGLVVPRVSARSGGVRHGGRVGQPRDDPLAQGSPRLGHPHGVNTTFTMPSSLSRNFR